MNGLKWINDNKGHKVGDEYIIAACKMICAIFKHSPVFRFGGDEFVVFLTEEDYEAQKSLFGALNKQSEQNRETGGVVVGSGLAEYRSDSDLSMLAVFDRADSRMYARKEELKGRGTR